MKKTLSLVLALLLALAMLSSASAAVTPKGEFPVVDEPMTVRLAIPVNSKVTDITTNELTLWMQEQTGLTFDILELSGSDTATQINMMMNSGDLPDGVLAYSFPYDQLCAYADAGLLAPLTEQVEKYGDNLQNVILADAGEIAMSYVTYDGEVYAVPSCGQLITNKYGHFYNRIQTKFLENLGMDMPTNLDELYEYLVAVRDNDANGNGDPSDEIPLVSSADRVAELLRFILQAYQYTDMYTFLKVNEQGQVEFVANNDLFREGIEYIKKLVDEGLLDPASFTQDESVLSTLCAQTDYAIGIVGNGYMVANVMDTTKDDYQDMRMMPNLEGPYGYKASMTEVSDVRASAVVTTAAEPDEADALFRLYDFLLSDESAIAVRVGFEGKEWKKADDGVIGRDGQQAWFSLLTTQEWIQPSTNVIWCNEGFIHSNIMNHCEATNTASKYPTSYDIIEWNYVAETTDELLPQLLMSAEDQQEYDELKNLIVSNVNENIALFVLGDKSLDQWDAYAEEFNSMGLERYIELAQTAYDAMK